MKKDHNLLYMIRSKCQVFSSTPSALFLRQGPLLKIKLSDFARLANHLHKLDLISHSCNSSTREVKARLSPLSSRPLYTIEMLKQTQGNIYSLRDVIKNTLNLWYPFKSDSLNNYSFTVHNIYKVLWSLSHYLFLWPFPFYWIPLLLSKSLSTFNLVCLTLNR